MTLKAVLFDCDGVIVDSEGLAFELILADLDTHGLHLTHEDFARNFLGGTMRNVYDRARAAGADLPADWVPQFYERLYERLAQGTPLIPGVLEVLDRLEAAGIPFAIGSNGTLQKMQITLGQHPGLIERFKGHLYSGQALGAPKPAPDLYLHAAAALGISPADCVVIEDSATGARAAKAAQMRCFGYAAQTSAEDLRAAGAQIFTEMRLLPGLLGL